MSLAPVIVELAIWSSDKLADTHSNMASINDVIEEAGGKEKLIAQIQKNYQMTNR